jgi:hypothetical protein
MSRLTRGLLLALLVAGLCALGLPSAGAVPDPASSTGLLRLVHLSPDTPSVDAAIDPVSGPDVGVALPAVGYGDVSPYSRLPAGTYTVGVRAAGADPADPPVLATTVTVAAGSATTVAAVGTFADLRFDVLTDDLTLPLAGASRVRVVNAAAAAPALDLGLGDRTLAAGLQFGDSTGYVDAPGGSATLTVTTGSGAPTQPVTLDAGSVYTLLVLDRGDGGLTVTPALDAASPGVVPVGGVEAGAGGTAGAPLPAGRLLLAVLAVAALLLTLRVRLSRSGRRTRRAAR